MSDEPPVKVMELFPFASFTFVEADRYFPLVPGKLIRSCKIRFAVTATVAVSQSWHISEDTSNPLALGQRPGCSHRCRNCS